MTKIFVEFDSIEQAQAAIYAVKGTRAAAPAPAFAPNVAPAAPAPAPAAPPPMPAAAAPAPAAPAPAPMPPAVGGVTQAQVVAAAQAFAKAYGPKAAKDRLAALGVTAVGQLQEAQYATAIEYFKVA